jgi:hypothetical protein
VLVSPGNVFSGWASCSSSFQVNGNLTCTPAYNGSAAPSPPAAAGSYVLSLINPGASGGGGFILGPEMVCEPGNVGTCTLSYTSPRTVTLIPFPYAGFSFGGWVEPGCADTMTITGPKTCTANFRRQ